MLLVTEISRRYPRRWSPNNASSMRS